MEIIINRLSKKISGNLILKNINLEFNSGMIYGIVGKNGSGKTMLLRSIAGLIIPTCGEVVVDGRKLHRDISFPPNMGIIIEKPTFLNHLSGLDNLRTLAEIRNVVSTKRILELMELFELSSNAKQKVSKYSLGMKQKLGIIQAIMEDPELLVLDEPFNALDEASVERVREMLLGYKASGKLIILTSHNKEDIEALCDCTYTISAGEIVG